MSPAEHKSACDACEGTGYEHEGTDPDPEANEGASCRACEGSGKMLWAWEPRDDAECGRCNRHAPCDGWGEDGEDPVCLDCARAAHRGLCGCDADGWS